MYLKRISTVLALVIGLCSCAANLQDANLIAPPAASTLVKEYTIGVGDTLSINVWRNEDLTMDVVVRPDGNISLPLIGDVKAEAKSANELAEVLKGQFVNFIRNPQVTVIVSSAVSAEFERRVRVTGAVQQPLSMAHRPGMTVLDAVLEAGGLNDYALANRAQLYRKTDSGVEAFEIRLSDILNRGKLRTNYQLAPSDIITVPERNF